MLDKISRFVLQLKFTFINSLIAMKVAGQDDERRHD